MSYNVLSWSGNTMKTKSYIPPKQF